MNEPLWELLELTIKTQFETNSDAAYNTLESFIKTHVYMNPSYKEKLVILKRLSKMLIYLNVPKPKIKDVKIPNQITKEKKRRILKSYEQY